LHVNTETSRIHVGEGGTVDGGNAAERPRLARWQELKLFYSALTMNHATKGFGCPPLWRLVKDVENLRLKAAVAKKK